MEYLNKLRDTVYNVKSSVNAVIPGNPVNREYDLENHVASAGPGLMWKIYSGTKKSTKQDVSVWIFEKNSVDRWPQRDKGILIETLKRGVSRLTRLRHPRLLVVEHPLEESRDSIAFATEPVFCSLANALGRIDNMPSFVPTELTDLSLDDVEIRHGLLQLAEALSFLHSDVKLLHRNVCPDSVIINRRGSWKLCGFDFCVSPLESTQADQPIAYPMLEWESDLHPFCQPSLDYIAPENIIGGRSDPAADIFSLGVLAYAVFNKGRTMMDNGNNLSTFKKNAQELKTLPVNTLRSLPEELREYVKMCLNFTADLRPDANQFSKISYFDNVGVKTLNYLESLCQLDNMQKSQFFKGLPNVLSTLPKRVQMQKILPTLTTEFSNPQMLPFVLPNVLLIAEGITPEEFQSVVLPSLTPVFAVRTPVQVMHILLQRMELILSKMNREDVRKHLFPVIYGALEADSVKIQELCLTIIPSISSMVDANSMKTQLLPKLMKLTTEASVLSVKVNALLCLGKMLEHLEKWMVTEQILPALPKINSKEPGVLMAVLGIYHMAFTNQRIGMTKELCARSALPFLIAMSVENSLNLKQFNTFMTLIRDMIGKVEVEQRAKLEQLSALQEEQRSGVDFNKIMTAGGAGGGKVDVGSSGDLSDVFTSLGLEEYSKTAFQSEPQQGTPKAGGNRGPLSLEEKQRLAREQEQTLRLRSQGDIKPVNAASRTASSPPSKGGSARSSTVSSPSTGPTDLTANLGLANLAPRPSNLVSMSSAPTVAPMKPTIVPTSQLRASPQASMNSNFQQPPALSYGSGAAISAGQSTNRLSGEFGSMASFGVTSSPHGGQMGMPGGSGFAGNNLPVNQSLHGQRQPMPQPRVDLSSFDNLVSFPNKPKTAFSTNLRPMGVAPFSVGGIGNGTVGQAQGLMGTTSQQGMGFGAFSGGTVGNNTVGSQNTQGRSDFSDFVG